jgi:hypothetical protein
MEVTSTKLMAVDWFDHSPKLAMDSVSSGTFMEMGAFGSA